jgi:hypothetical protein
MSDVHVFDTSDDDRQPDTSEIEPRDSAGGAPEAPAASAAVLIAEPPAQPLCLPGDPPSREAAIAVAELRGFALSPDWLPEGLSPAIDQVRARHVRLVGEAQGCLDLIGAVRRQANAEARTHDRAVRQAIRDGAEPPEDERTPPHELHARIAEAEQKFWATIVVLAEDQSWTATGVRGALPPVRVLGRSSIETSRITLPG